MAGLPGAGFLIPVLSRREWRRRREGGRYLEESRHSEPRDGSCYPAPPAGQEEQGCVRKILGRHHLSSVFFVAHPLRRLLRAMEAYVLQNPKTLFFKDLLRFYDESLTLNFKRDFQDHKGDP